LYGITTAASADPRLRSECLRRVTGEDSVVLVGVLHDHPASLYRVQAIVESEDPDLLALELPPLAVPLAAQPWRRPLVVGLLGGEMSAAIQAAATDRVVGIDGPTPSFFRQLARRLVRERASASTALQTLRSAVSITKDAVACRVAAAVTANSRFEVGVGTSTGYETGWSDDPSTQAEDEHSQITRANAVLSAFEQPPSAHYRTTTRERHMAERLRASSTDGDVVAVVGMGHLDAVAGRLADGG